MSAPEKTTKPGRGLRIALFVSLAFNLLIVGVVAGGLASGRIGGDKPRVGFDLGPIARILDQDARREIGREVRSNPQTRPLSMRQRRQDLAELVELLRAETFDADAVSAIFDRQREAGFRVVKGAQDAFVGFLSTAPLSDRIVYADRLEADISRMPSGPRGGPPKSDN